jgi:hypothetical protein
MSATSSRRCKQLYATSSGSTVGHKQAIREFITSKTTGRFIPRPRSRYWVWQNEAKREDLHRIWQNEPTDGM